MDVYSTMILDHSGRDRFSHCIFVVVGIHDDVDTHITFKKVT